MNCQDRNNWEKYEKERHHIINLKNKSIHYIETTITIISALNTALLVILYRGSDYYLYKISCVSFTISIIITLLSHHYSQRSADKSIAAWDDWIHSDRELVGCENQCDRIKYVSISSSVAFVIAMISSVLLFIN